jgi:hypothetical protein
MYDVRLQCIYLVVWPNFELKAWLKQLLGYLRLDIPLLCFKVLQQKAESIKNKMLLHDFN